MSLICNVQFDYKSHRSESIKNAIKRKKKVGRKRKKKELGKKKKFLDEAMKAQSCVHRRPNNHPAIPPFGN